MDSQVRLGWVGLGSVRSISPQICPSEKYHGPERKEKKKMEKFA